MVLIVYGRLATVDNNGAVVKLVYTTDLKSVTERYGGSNPSRLIMVVVRVYRV
jgi:hypothetical protein